MNPKFMSVAGVRTAAALARSIAFANVAKIGALAICYFAAAKVSLLFAIPPGYATAVWPPAGIALAVMLIGGVRLWPGVWLGAALANFTVDLSPPLSFAIATGNTLEAVCAIWLAHRFIGAVIEFRRVDTVFRFAAIGAVSSLASALPAALTLFFSGRLLAENLLVHGYTWWQGDTTAIMVVTPFLLAWIRERDSAGAAFRLTELIVFWAVLAVALMAVFAFDGWTRPDVGYALNFLPIPVLAWAGCRFGLRAITAAILLVMGTAIWGMANNRGLFLLPSLDESLLVFQAFISAVALMGLALYAATRERMRAVEDVRRSRDQFEIAVVERTAELAQKNLQLATDLAERERLASILQHREAQLAEAQALTHIGSWSWDVKSDRVIWSEELFRIYGLSPDQFEASFDGYLSRVHPDDRRLVSAVVQTALADHRPWEMTERIIRPDRTTRVLKSIGKVVVDESGEVIYVYGVCIDATEQIRLERIQAVQNQVASVLAHAPTPVAALTSVLRIVCEQLDWVVGQAWQVDSKEGALLPAQSWSAPPRDLSAFVAQSRRMTFELGRGLPGRIWEQGGAVWIEDVCEDPNFPRARFAAGAGLHAAWGFPLMAGGQVLGVMEFFGVEVQKPDHALLLMTAAVGTQLGEYLVRNKAQRLLEESEERFRLLVEQVRDYAILMLSPDGRVESWNAGAQQISGYEAGEIVGEHFSCFYPQEDIASGKAGRALDVARMEGRYEDEGWRERKGGARYWANVIITPLYADDGTLRGYAKVTRDMTRRREVQEALRQSETLLRSVLDTLPVGVWVINSEGQIVQCNPAGQKIWGGARYVGAGEYGVYKGWWAGTDRLIEPREWAWARAIERGETSLGELVDIECFDGTRKTILNSAVPLRDAEGRIAGAITVNEDVTARRLAEEAVASIATGVSAATATEFFRLLAQQLTKVLAVDGALIGELTGTKDAEVRTVAGVVDGKIIDNFTYNSDGSPCAKALAENVVVFADDARTRFTHTPVLDLFEADSYIGIGLWAADGSALGVMMVLNRKPLQYPDLAKSILRIFASRAAAELERKRSEEKIRSLAIHLQNVIEKERARIAREIHDELGQSLTGLKMDLSWLSKTLGKVDAKSSAQIRSMSDFIDSMIHSVRRISTDLRPGELDDLGLVAAIESHAKEFERRTGIACRMNLPDEDIAVDDEVATAIFRICQELLTNVARHSGATMASVDLELDDGWLAITVQDYGRGIRPAEASNRFAIGLAGIRERANLLGGSATINGKPGKGTLAQVRIPVNQARNLANGNENAASA